MAKKNVKAKPSKSVKAPAKTKLKVVTKPVKKAVTKPVLKAAPKPVKTAKVAQSVKAPKTEKLKVVKPVVDKKNSKQELEPKNKGSALLEMAKNEMSQSKIGSNEEAKAEKVSKMKPIKVERGNLADEKAKWIELNKRYGKEKALNYKMSESYESLRPLQHKVLGWGFILTNEDNRLEVLFENGIKMLISNYKPN